MFTVWGSYNYTPSAELYYSVLWILFFAILGFKIYFSPKQIKECHPKYPVVSKYRLSNALGEDVSFDASYTDELLDQYKAFEYDKMFAKQYTQEVY